MAVERFLPCENFTIEFIIRVSVILLAVIIVTFIFKLVIYDTRFILNDIEVV